jgi:hypothetical protein
MKVDDVFGLVKTKIGYLNIFSERAVITGALG